MLAGCCQVPCFQPKSAPAARVQAEREARIAAETEAAGPSDKMLEEEKLSLLLAPHGLQIREVRVGGGAAAVCPFLLLGCIAVPHVLSCHCI